MALRDRNAGQFAAGPGDRPILPASLANLLTDTVRAGAGLVLLAILAACWISLLTWSSLDPSFTSIASREPRNVLGLPGAYAADVGLQTLGLAAFALLLAPMFWSVSLIRGEPLPALGRKLALYVFGIGCLSAAASAWITVPGWPLSYGLGGIAGDRLLALASGPALPYLGELARWCAAVVLGAAGIIATLTACGAAQISRRRRASADRSPSRAVSPRGPSSRAEPTFAPARSVAFAGSLDTDTRRWGPDPLEPDEAAGDWHGAAWHDEAPGPSRPHAPSDRTLRQFGPYAYSACDLEPEPAGRRSDDPEFEAWTEASTSGMASRFAPADNAPHALQSALASAFGFTSAPRKATGATNRAARDAERARAAEVYRRPSLNLLERPVPPRAPSAYAQSLVRGNARLLSDALAEFGIEGTLREIEHGPVLTIFLFEIARGTKLSRVIALADDIAGHVGAAALRIVERPGPGLIAIELPNADRTPVVLRDCLDSEAYRSALDALPIAIGLNTSGEPVVANLAQMPAMLVSGGEGAAKATGLNAMILSLIYRHGPEDCRLLLIDPRMVDLAVYDGIPHLLTPVVGDPHKAITALGWCVREMEERVKRMAALGVRNIELFNNRVRNARKRGEALQRTVQTGFDDRTGKARYVKEDISLEPMPYIVIVVEELADLMAVAGKDIEAAMSRLAKAARSVGIHLIIATERPTADIVTGPIRASLPTRLCYKAANRAESRSVLGHEGAEHLLPGGDALLASGPGQPVRLHGPMVSAEEVASVAMSLKERGTAHYVAGVMEAGPVAPAAPVFDGAGGTAAAGAGPAPSPANPMDDLFDRAVALAVRDGGSSIGHLQGTLKVSAGWAASLLGRLEADGVLGPADDRGIHRLRPPGSRNVA